MKHFTNKVMIWSRILGLFGLGSCSPSMSGADKWASLRNGDGNPELSVLFIGNSYSFEVPKVFARLARARGKQVHVAQSTIGGWTLEKHMTQAETLAKLRSRKWDIVVLQDHSLHPGSMEVQRREVMDPALRFFAEEARAMDAVPLLYQTWGRRDGLPDIQGADFFEMNERVRQGSRKAAELAGDIGIVPVGDAWEREFHAGNGAMLYQEDGSHPSSTGDQVTAAEFYRVIFGEEA